MHAGIIYDEHSHVGSDSGEIVYSRPKPISHAEKSLEANLMKLSHRTQKWELELL